MKHETPERAEMARKRWKPIVRLMQIVRRVKSNHTRSNQMEVIKTEAEKINDRDRTYNVDEAHRRQRLNGLHNPEKRTSYLEPRTAVFGPKSNLTT